MCPSITELLAPTRIYTELYLLYQHQDIGKHLYGVAHITGGGFSNINRVLPKGYTYELNLNADQFPPIFQWIQKYSGLGTVDMMNTFNCGYGMVLVGNKDLADLLPTNTTVIGKLKLNEI